MTGGGSGDVGCNATVMLLSGCQVPVQTVSVGFKVLKGRNACMPLTTERTQLEGLTGAKARLAGGQPATPPDMGITVQVCRLTAAPAAMGSIKKKTARNVRMIPQITI